jgi:hypothetical protein
LSILLGLTDIVRRFNRERKSVKSFKESEIITVLPRDAIMSVANPVHAAGEEAERQMRVGESVLGIEINGDTRAYPVNILTVHEIISDTVGGIPVAVTW